MRTISSGDLLLAPRVGRMRRRDACADDGPGAWDRSRRARRSSPAGELTAPGAVLGGAVAVGVGAVLVGGELADPELAAGVALDGDERLPGDAQDDQGDDETDDRVADLQAQADDDGCLLYTSPSPRDS